MKKIAILVLFLISTKVISQGFPDNPTQIKEIPPSPTMWEFEKYGNYPVSMHTGVPNISIPITTVQSGVLQVPISLNYHASGIKIDQKASWVGLGWSLKAGGAITRTIRGTPDEGQKGYINYPYRSQGTFDPAFSNNYYETEEMLQGFVDTEPDIFNYNFLGYSGKFIFNHDGTIALIPHNDLKVTRELSLFTFTIITPEGITAEFAYPETSSEYRPAGNIGDLTVNARNVWHLKKLTAPNGIDIITFDYELVLGNPIFDYRVSESVSINYPDPCNSFNYTIQNKTTFPTVTYSQVKRIKKINYQNGYILFQSSTGNRDDDPDDEVLRLDAIKMYSSLNGTDKLIKSYEMEYDYFGTLNPSIPKPEHSVRLKLQKIFGVGSNSIRNKPHEFFYKDSGVERLPHRFSKSQDYWGYYNGKQNSTLVPRYHHQMINGEMIYLGDADRNVDSFYARAGIIEKIIYPTKGYSIFEFESNTATLLGNQYVLGGLRIKDISNFDTDDTIKWQKSYEYVQKENPTLSSGVYNGNKFIEPRDFFYGSSYYFTILSGSPYKSCHYNVTPVEFNTHNEGISSSPSLTNNFASVFYASVKEYNGSSTNHGGYKWYHYATTKDDFIQGLGPINFSIDRSWDRGQLLLEQTFEKNNTTPKSTVTYTFEKVQAQTAISGFKPGVRFNVQGLGYVPSGMDPYAFRAQQYFLTYYEEPIVWKRLKSTTTVQDGITTQKNFFYENPGHTGLTKIETNDSKGNYLISKTRYPNDFINSTTLYDNTLIKGGVLDSYTEIDRLKSNDLHQNATPIQVETYKKVGTTESLLSLQRTDFVDLGSNLVLPSLIQTLKGDYDPITNPLQDRVQYHSYYANGKPREISKAGGTKTVYIWSYNNTLPVAKIDNATFSEVQSIMNSYSGGFITSLGTETDKEIIAGNLVQLRNDLATGVLSNALVSTYIYDPLIGTVMITAPNGLNTHYQYDSLNRLKAVLNNDEDVVQYINYNYKSEPEITLSINTYNFSDAAGSKSVTVTSNRNWIVSESVSWLSISTSSGSNDGSFIINCTANTGSARSATVTVTAEGITQTISVTQDEKSLDFTLTQLGTSYQTSSFSNSTINSSELPKVIYHYALNSFNYYGSIVLDGSDSFTFNIEYDYHAYGWINASYNSSSNRITLTFTDPGNGYTNYASVNVTANGITKILSIKFTSDSNPPY